MVFNAGGKVKYGAFIPLDFDECKEIVIPRPRKERIINGLKDIRDALYSEYPENYMRHYDNIINDAIDYIENFEGGGA